MSDTPNAAPAGASEQALAPQMPTGPLDRAAAAALIASLPDDPPEPAAAGAGTASEDTSDNTLEDPAQDAGDGGEAQDSGETAADEGAAPADEVETEADDEPEVIIHGNTMLVLRDGTKVRASDARKAIGELQELRGQLPTLTAAAEKAKEYEARAAQLAQQEQIVQQALPGIRQIFADWQAQLPPEPDPQLIEDDPIGYAQQAARRQVAMSQLQQRAAAFQQYEQQQAELEEKKQKAQDDTRLNLLYKALVERIPTFATPAGMEEVVKGIVDASGPYGIPADEVKKDFIKADPRVIHMFHELSQKAAAYDRLMAQKPPAVQQTPPAPVKRAAPVQQPGRRVAPGEAEQRGLNERLQKWREGGYSKEDAVAVLTNLS